MARKENVLEQYIYCSDISNKIVSCLAQLWVEGGRVGTETD